MALRLIEMALQQKDGARCTRVSLVMVVLSTVVAGMILMLRAG